MKKAADKNGYDFFPGTGDFFKQLSDAFLNEVPVGISVCSTGNNPLYIVWNRYMEKITDIPAGKALGRNVHSFYPQREAEAVAIRDEITVRGKKVARFPDNIINNRVVDIIKVPFLNSTGEVDYIMTAVIDTTDQRKMFEKVVQAEKMQMVGQLAGGIAHDFNNQLMAILGYSQLLKERVSHPELSQYLKSIIQSAEKSAELTAKLLAYSRRGKLTENNIDINRIIDEVILLAVYKSDSSSGIITIEKEIAPGSYCLSGDATLIQDSIFVLVLNSLDAMPEGGTITISAQKAYINPSLASFVIHDAPAGSYLKITVKDTGKGIERENLPRIFEPFFTTKKGSEGSGMGLAAVFGTIKSHDGTISVESAAGAGTAISLYFPVCEDEGDKGESHKVYEKKTKTTYFSGQNSKKPILGEVLKIMNPVIKPKHIIVVDDEKIVRDLTGEMLKRIGYEVTLFDNAVSALDYFRQNIDSIDLVILDMIMPQMGGREAFYKFRSMDPDVKIIILSGFSIDNETQDLVNEGISAFIQKPVSLSVLKNRLEEIFSSRAEDEKPAADSENSNVAVPEIEGFNTASALEKLDGDLTLYMKILKRFLESYTNSSAQLLEKFRVQDYSWVHTFSHSMKSLAGNMGSETLFSVAEKTESAAKTGDISSLAALVPELASAIEKAVKQIGSFYSEKKEYSAGVSAGEAATADMIPVYIGNLKDALRIHSPKKSKEVFENLRQCRLPEKSLPALLKAEKLITGYKFSEALSAIDEFEQLLK